MGNVCQQQEKKRYKIADPVSSLTTQQRQKKNENEKPVHEGVILGLSVIENKIISCSDDKTIAVSPWINSSPLQKTTEKFNEICHLKGHNRAVNRVVGFENNSHSLMCWSASRDLSLRCVSYYYN